MTESQPPAESAQTPESPTPPAITPQTTPQTWPAAPSASMPSGSVPSGSAPAAPPATTGATYPDAVRTAVPTSSNAVVALVLAIASWAICPIIAAIVALIFAGQAAKEIRAGQGAVGGQGLVTAARIIAWIHIGVIGAFIVIFLIILIIAAIAGSSVPATP